MSSVVPSLDRPRSRAGPRAAVVAAAAAALSALACSAPATRSVTDAEIAELASRRSSLEDVAAALELADLGALAVPVPGAPRALEPDLPEFWHACAFAWNPELRRARRELLALRAAVRGSGAPGALMLDVEHMDLSDSDADLELMATVDLLGLLGVGPAPAQRALARAEDRSALAELESAVWRIRFEVDRARVRFASARATEIVLEALLQHASEDLPRIEVLARSGWIGSAMEQAAYAAVHRIEHAQSAARQDSARARAELARICGLDPTHEAFERMGGGVVDRFRAGEIRWRDPAPTDLLASLPELRSAKLELAVAEAELRRVARERWPSLRIGPKVIVMRDDTNVGGLLGIEIPFPGSVEGRVEAARQRREAAREALEDALVAARTRIAETRELLAEALERLEEHAPELDTAVARMFVAAQAGFRVDPEGLTAWTLALGERVESLTMLAEARADAVIAHLGYEEARGSSAEARP
jgi:outer membrane protein TolC